MPSSTVSMLSPPLATLAVLVTGCADQLPLGGPPKPPREIAIQASLIVSGLSDPLYLAAPRGDSRLFVVERRGVIRIIEDAALLPSPFLDISARVSSDDLRGMISVAFHPQFAQNGRFYVYFTDRDGTARIERFVADPQNPSRADPSSATLVLEVAQPSTRHHGGHLVFGPDGMLYIAMGDGGRAGDRDGHAQSLTSLLGKLLRIDVQGSDPYGIPADNPYVNQTGVRPEIWARGLRNPWRIAFDAPSGMLLVTDVGEQGIDEINIRAAVIGGINYGWNVTLGSACYQAQACVVSGLSPPTVAYTRAMSACALIGGMVYRGAAMSALRGHYFYADRCRAGVQSARLSAGALVQQQHWAIDALGPVVSFGTDARGELYVITAAGSVNRLDLKP